MLHSSIEAASIATKVYVKIGAVFREDLIKHCFNERVWECKLRSLFSENDRFNFDVISTVSRQILN
jgi:hypothetical protein